MTRFSLAPVAFAAIVPAAVLMGCHKVATKPPRAAVPVTLSTVKREAIPVTVMANGSVSPMQTANVSSQVDGIITEVAFREGQDVEQGQILFRIDARPYLAAYDQAKAALERDKASAVYAAQEVVRYDSLVAKDYVTKEQADQERATAASAQATVAADSAAVVTAKFNYDNTVVRAPIAGRTGSLLVRTGNLVHGAAATPLVVINQIHPILVQFAVPAANLPDIQKHVLQGKLPVTVYQVNNQNSNASDTAGSDTSQSTSIVPAGGGVGADPSSFTPAGPGIGGDLSFINNAVDTTTGTVLLKGTFENTHNELWPGEYVATVLRLYIQQDAIVVPAQAIMTGQQGTYVFLVDSTNTARQQAVGVSRVTDSIAVVTSGLTPGERVVTDGQSRLQSGAKVTTRAPNANGGTRAGGAHHPGGSDSTASQATPQTTPQDSTPHDSASGNAAGHHHRRPAG